MEIKSEFHKICLFRLYGSVDATIAHRHRWHKPYMLLNCFYIFVYEKKNQKNRSAKIVKTHKTLLILIHLSLESALVNLLCLIFFPFTNISTKQENTRFTGQTRWHTEIIQFKERMCYFFCAIISAMFSSSSKPISWDEDPLWNM